MLTTEQALKEEQYVSAALHRMNVMLDRELTRLKALVPHVKAWVEEIARLRESLRMMVDESWTIRYGPRSQAFRVIRAGRAALRGPGGAQGGTKEGAP
jgi:hypothetical protein